MPVRRSSYFSLSVFALILYAPRMPADPLTRSVYLRSQLELETLFCRPYFIETPWAGPHPPKPHPPGTPHPPPHPRDPRAKRAHGALWGYSEVISNGWLFRGASHFEWLLGAGRGVTGWRNAKRNANENTKGNTGNQRASENAAAERAEFERGGGQITYGSLHEAFDPQGLFKRTFNDPLRGLHCFN